MKVLSGENIKKNIIEVYQKIPFGYVVFCNLVPYTRFELFKWCKKDDYFVYPEKVFLN